MHALWISFLFGSCFITKNNAFLSDFLIEANCTLLEFPCRNGNCIPISKRCDDHNDCSDNSDESDCDQYHCLEPNYFKCKNEKCISTAFVCDAENDCGDFSDEKNCDTYKFVIPPTQCTTNEWQCLDNMCIPTDFVCNGEPDCLDGSDETLGCTVDLKNCDTFKCKNGHCIPNEWICDGNNDCKDNSDEMNCESVKSPEECKLANRLYLCKNNKTCLSTNKVCNNITDCPDGSDEGSLCDGLRTCKNINCSHECLNLPTGPKCICSKGYKTVDGNTCVDINECEQYGICDQKCRNSKGSYECYCDSHYTLQNDKKTCKVNGGEALMIFSSKTEIRGYYLTSKVLFPIARNLKQVVGVGYDGNHVYWTDIFTEHESIIRSLEDGSQKELLVTAGLGAPEDLAIDWITRNIYFTDSELSHIGVCTNDGFNCAVIVNEDIHRPRGIALNPQAGEMYWSDWGDRPLIAHSTMAGANAVDFVNKSIYWPNGIAIDLPSERLYWADAKLMTLESIKFDGTDRRIVLENIVKHPYAVAIFENNIYWSDWSTRSVQSCNKFTGKNHTTLFTERREYVFGIHIYHSSLKQSYFNPCSVAFCSDICLLNGSSYKCACPDGKELASDGHICKVTKKKQILIAGSGNSLMRIEHKKLGKHDITMLPSIAKEIGMMAYNDDHDILYVYDSSSKSIITLNLTSGFSHSLDVGEPLGSLTGMAFDYIAGNLYWCDSKKATVEVLNIKTMSRKVVVHDLGNQIPNGLTLIPEEGIMFVAFEKTSHMGVHIDRILMDGSKRTHVIEEGLLGPIALIYDRDLHRVFWSDASTGNIESTSADGDDRHGFRSLQTSPLSITSLADDIFWTNLHSKRIYWAKKNNVDNGYNKKITLDLPNDQKIHLVSIQTITKTPNKCRVNNGGCSHLCLLSGKSIICSCPIGMNLKEDNKTCFKPKQCDYSQFHCTKTDTCIPRNLRCNGKNDCFSGEDEEGCNIKTNMCPSGQFQCDNGECIKSSLHCDLHFDCKDKSDESNCDGHDDKACPDKYFQCNDGKCIAERYVCDGTKDCNYGEDELKCLSCTMDEFRCLSGACLPLSFECDGDYDCADLSDEHSNCPKRVCSNNKFTCDNGKCVDRNFLCNHVDDCGDLSDEAKCKSNVDGCNFNEFQCKSNRSICLPMSAKCNGTSECPHHEDEAGCSECHVDEFECKNKLCIPTAWICDGSNDCKDNTDESEELCNHTSITIDVAEDVPCDHGFRCKTGHCIEMSLVCNNEENCYDGSDENGACKTSCQSTTNPCSQVCIKTPSGPMCECNPGFKLLGDGHTCVDIEECKMEPPLCSQLCTEALGNFSCNCYDGFIIRGDQRSCKSIGKPMKLLYTVDNEIHQISKALNTLSVIYSDNTPPISGLTVSSATNSMYFTVKEAGTLSRKNLTDGSHKYITGLEKPGQIAIDWIAENIYYVEDSTINVCHFGIEKCSKIYMSIDNAQVSAITIDAINKYIFFALTKWWHFNSPTSHIFKCNLDGSKLKEIATAQNSYVTGIAFDINKKKIYYGTQHMNQIYRMNYDGLDKVLLFALNDKRPFGLQLFEDHLYFLTVGGYMERCNLFGSELECNNFRLSGYAVKYFTILQENTQPKQQNICNKHNCTHLCIPSDVGVRCLCENGYTVKENQSCDQRSKALARSAEDSDKKPKFQYGSHLIYKSSQRESTGSIVAGILIPIMCVLLAALVYYYIKKRKSGHFYVNSSSIRFTNKTYWVNEDEPANLLEPGQHEYCNPIEFNKADNTSDSKQNKTDSDKRLIAFDS